MEDADLERPGLARDQFAMRPGKDRTHRQMGVEQRQPQVVAKRLEVGDPLAGRRIMDGDRHLAQRYPGPGRSRQHLDLEGVMAFPKF